MDKTILVVNQKFSFQGHTDSVNKIATEYLNAARKRSEIRLVLNRGWRAQIKALLKGTFDLRGYLLLLRKESLIICVSEAEVPWLLLFQKRCSVIIILHGAEFFSHPELRAKSRYRLRERLARNVIRCIKNRENVSFKSVSNWASITWKNGFNIHSKIAVIGNPINSNYYSSEFQESKGYILHVSNLKPQKNFGVVLEVYAEYRRNGGKLDLVVAGPNKPSTKVKFIHRPDDDELLNLQSGANVLIFPSYVESFGMPIVESLLLGVPVITSNQTACNEFQDQEGLYKLNPNEIKEMADLLLNLENLRMPDRIRIGNYSRENFKYLKADSVWSKILEK